MPKHYNPRLTWDTYEGEIQLEKEEKPISLAQEASYIVYIGRDGYVKAKNGRTGHVEFRDRDASTVIQQAINAMNEGERIVIRGDMTFNSPINILKRIIYEHYGTMTLNMPAGGAGIVVGDATHQVNHAEIYVHRITGQDKSRDGIRILNGSGNRFRVHWVEYCRYAIHLKQETEGVRLGENIFEYTLISNNKKGFYVSAPPVGQAAAWAEGTQLEGGGMFTNDEHGVLVESGCHAGGMLITGVIDNADVVGSYDYVNNMASDQLGSLLMMKFIRENASVFHPNDVILNENPPKLGIGDVEFRREASNLWAVMDALVLRCDTCLRPRPSALNSAIIETAVDGVTTIPPFVVLANGRMEWGSGSAARDIILERAAANLLTLASGNGLRVPGSVRTFVKSGVPTDADIPNAEDGAIVVDSLNNRLYVRVGGVWKYAALT